MATNSKMPRKRTRLGLLLSMGASLALLAVAYNTLFLSRPIGQGPAGPKVDAADFATVWSERSVMLLGIGDSITAGLGARSPSHSYFQRLLNNPEDEYPDMQGLCLSKVLPQIDSKNIAVSGSTSLQHMDYISERLKPFDEQVFGLVVLTTGGNDIIHNYGRSPPREGAMYGATLAQAEPWIANFSSRLSMMLDNIEALFPGGCEIYLADIYDPTDGVGDAPSVFLPDWPDGLAIHAQYNQAIVATAEQRPGVFLVSLHQSFLGHGAHCRQFWRSTYDKNDPHYWFYENIEDPNDRGYDAIRRVFLTTIANSTNLKSR